MVGDDEATKPKRFESFEHGSRLSNPFKTLMTLKLQDLIILKPLNPVVQWRLKIHIFLFVITLRHCRLGTLWEDFPSTSPSPRDLGFLNYSAFSPLPFSPPPVLAVSPLTPLTTTSTCCLTIITHLSPSPLPPQPPLPSLTPSSYSLLHALPLREDLPATSPTLQKPSQRLGAKKRKVGTRQICKQEEEMIARGGGEGG